MKTFRGVLFCVIVAISSSFAQSPLTPDHQLARDILKQLIEINTTDTPLGNVTSAAEAMAARRRVVGSRPT